ncbi:hypothetical protein [Peptoniphilus sp. oral taxon 386]|uniref:hypothetical protein n=1 Tax=Peptoniphilus sp. oral taxon 386 TaxID=652713 RepID=UPI0001DAA0E6|nr:hypothetical protein [Peptoniphilus sp. oral taxon 386]EFI41677.1 hypothetical protein HMPREF0629_00301 [Peptoniphilus sp. oral taxon 386 str. F0131]
MNSIIKKEEIKAREISDELMYYFFSENIHTFSIYVTFYEDHFIISARGKTKTPPKSVDDLMFIMNSKRMSEVEDYYDGILGFGHTGSDYNILGTLIDEASVTFEDEILNFVIRRNF